MKQTLFFVLVILIASPIFGQGTYDDEARIKAIIQQQAVDWNKHDWKSLSAHYVEDASLINFVGEAWKTRKDILSHFKLLSACCLEPTSLKFDCKEIRFLAPTIALVFIEETLYANRDYDVPFRKYKKGEIDYKWRVDVFEKRNSEWKIVSTQMTLINPMIKSAK